MLTLKRNIKLNRHLLAACQRYLATKSEIVTNTEYTEVPEYPKILDLSFRARKERDANSWHEEIRAVPTVEEKLIKINMPRYYGYKVVKLSDEYLPYNCLGATQHYTRTVFEEIKPASKETTEETAPATEKPLELQTNVFIEALKDDVKAALEFVNDFYSHKPSNAEQIDPVEKERMFTQMIVEQIHRSLMNTLSPDYQHLYDVEIDYNPRHEAFWAVGGINPSKNVRQSKKGHKWQQEMSDDPVDRFFRYSAKPYLAVRHKHQLPTWRNEAESINMDLAKEIPRFNFDPRSLGFKTDYAHATNIPGFWPGSQSGFGCISYQSRAYFKNRAVFNAAEDSKDALHAQGIQSSYAWLLALANYNGFNTYNDLTYPMNTQTIITNGRDWSFYEYQLHTLLVHSRHIDENPKVNFCRGTGEMQLYEEINKNGEVVGFNTEVLRHLVRFYSNVPNVKRSESELTPYLHPEYKYIADLPDAEQRIWLEKTFKHLVTNQKRHLEIPEIYMWEKIYKIDHKTRPIEPRRRFFELEINPWKRTLDQHQKEYIPRSCRPEGPKSRKKWKKTYYP